MPWSRTLSAARGKKARGAVGPEHAGLRSETRKTCSGRIISGPTPYPRTPALALHQLALAALAASKGGALSRGMRKGFQFRATVFRWIST